MDPIHADEEESRLPDERHGDPQRSGSAWQRDEFVAQLAHELRGPLGAIHNAAQVLRRCAGDRDTIGWVEGVLDRQTNQMIRLIEDLLDQCRLNHNGFVLSKQPVDLAAIVDGAIETVRPGIEDRGHRLEVAMPAAPVTVEADPSRLEQVLTNLLANAAKYTEPGGRIELTAACEQHEIVLTVRDSGVGIGPEELPHIFDPFWQSSRATRYARSGLGIGLALVRQFVELHAGSVSAFSKGLGLGSEFVVRLPQAASNGAAGGYNSD